MAENIEEQLKQYDQLYKEQDDFYRKAAQWAGLSDAAHWVLYQLCRENKDLIQSDLCKEWYFSKQTVNSAVTKLVKEGYVELKLEIGKGHRKLLSLTEKGKMFTKQYIVPIMNAEKKSFMILSKEEREMLLTLMKKQLDALNEVAEELWQ